MTKTLKYK